MPRCVGVCRMEPTMPFLPKSFATNLAILALVAGPVFVAGRAIAAEPGLTADVSEPKFEAHIRPLFKAYCVDCHGGLEPQGKLDLRLRRNLISGGESGPAIVAGNPDGSNLLARVVSGEMPPSEKKVPPEQIELLRRWIAQGAPTAGEEPESIAADHLFPEELGYWAFRPVTRPTVTAGEVANQRVRTDIDALVRRRLQGISLDFNPDADRRTLVRRVYIDLTGLPPSYEEANAFANDPSPTAYEDLVERLLASPRYGERWGRHWLDVIGYADSDGDATRDTERPYAYRYRDYVVNAFNRGLPFNQMLIEQIAGDELLGVPFDVRNTEHHRLLSATGMLRMPADPTANGGGDEEKNQAVANTVKMFGSAFFGMSVACAQCHDHRYDPISQVDYFRIRAVFEPAMNPKAWRFPRERWVSLYTDEDRAKVAAVEAEAGKLVEAMNAKQATLIDAALEKEIAKLPADMQEVARAACKTPADKRTPEQTQFIASRPNLSISAGTLYQYNQAAADDLKKDQTAIDTKRAEKPVEEFLSVINEIGGTPPETMLFYRGDYRAPKQPVAPGDLRVATQGAALTIPSDDSVLSTSGRRLAFAKHLVDGKHPLIGRVLVNRLWLHHFGRGLVDTPGEFGNLGQRPSHPELIDWLADELVRNDWDLKHLHRTIVTSTVYRQSSARTPENNAADTDGALYSRYPVRRLEAEAIRDASLAAAGRLELAMYGKPVAVEEDFAGQVSPAGDSPRRSLYIQVRRSKPVALLTAFDAPVMECNCERRTNSTVATQSLMMMNNDYLLRRANEIAALATSESQRTGPIELSGIARRAMAPSEAWQYGYGGISESGETKFTKLPQFAEGRWQGSPQFPDPQLGYVMLRPEGGHPDLGPERATVRRWTAPSSFKPSRVVIHGSLSHNSENGDGVRGRVVVRGKDAIVEWRVKNGKTETHVELNMVQPGDTIDFVVDALEHHTSDSFGWVVEIKATDADGGQRAWKSDADFSPTTGTLFDRIAHAWRLVYQRNPSSEEMDVVEEYLISQIARLKSNPETAATAEQQALAHLCQQLLASNEFLYVD
jgi:mono/diheme cytochrome c family protein